jgi:antitoxin (DNA-binding transcriptional repressor) of toxin-antitoxin stability system
MTVTLDSSEAGRRFSEIVEQAGHGQTTIITHDGKVCAVLTPPPLSTVEPPSILELRGSGRGFWGPDVEGAIRSLRDEWGSR